MKVRELLKALNQFDSDLDVVIYAAWGQTKETATSVELDAFNSDGETIYADDWENTAPEDMTFVVTIYGQ